MCVRVSVNTDFIEHRQSRIQIDIVWKKKFEKRKCHAPPVALALHIETELPRG